MRCPVLWFCDALHRRRRIAGSRLRVDRLFADACGIAVAEVDVRPTVQVELVVDARVGDRSRLPGAVQAPRRGRGIEVADAGVVDPAGVHVVLDDPRRGADPLHGGESSDRGNLRSRRLDVDDDAFVPENLDAVHLLQGTDRPRRAQGRPRRHARDSSAGLRAPAGRASRQLQPGCATRAGSSRPSELRRWKRSRHAARAWRAPCRCCQEPFRRSARRPCSQR